MVLERRQHGLVQVLTLNRPEAANSLNPELLDAVALAFHEIATDDATQAVVLTAAGDRIFCAGMDLMAFSESRNDKSRGAAAGTGYERDESAPRYNLRNLSPKPVIAAVNGAAVGGGFEVALACDLVVAADTARFGLPEVKRGLIPTSGTTLLGTRIPLALALEIALTGELIDAERALAWGLVNRVVPGAELLDASLALATTIAANGPIGVRMTKELMRRAVLDDPKRGWATPEETSIVFQSEDAKEGAQAFLEKRPPNWKGR